MTDIRLEDALAEIAHLNEQCDIFVREINAKAIDNERLRATLQSLTHDPPATLDEPDTDAEVIIKMREIARRALEPKP